MRRRRAGPGDAGRAPELSRRPAPSVNTLGSARVETSRRRSSRRRGRRASTPTRRSRCSTCSAGSAGATCPRSSRATSSSRSRWSCTRSSSSPTRCRSSTASGTRSTCRSEPRSRERSAPSTDRPTISRAPSRPSRRRGSGATALASAGVKSALRLGINTSPEPASNIVASLLEDGLVGLVVFIAVEYPLLAALIAATLLVSGIALAIFLAKRIRRAYVALRRHYGRGPPAPSPP